MPKKPIEITQEFIDEFCKYIQEGNYIETVCDLMQINKDTVYKWIRLGGKGNPKYKPFADAVKKAMAQSEMFLLAVLSRAAEKGQWKAAAWRLERKSPKRWGYGPKEDISNLTGDKIKVVWVSDRDVIEDEIEGMDGNSDTTEIHPAN